jgi:hypothetical protein
VISGRNLDAYITGFSLDAKRSGGPESTTLFRNPAAGADIPAFDTSRAVGDIVCLLHRAANRVKSA